MLYCWIPKHRRQQPDRSWVEQGVCWGSSTISSRTTKLVSSVPTIVRIARGGGDGLLHLLKAQAAVDLGAVEEQLLRLVLRGHQHQSPLTVDAGLKPGAGSQAEGIPHGPGQGELALGGERDGGHDVIVRRSALRADPLVDLALVSLAGVEHWRGRGRGSSGIKARDAERRVVFYGSRHRPDPGAD